MNDNEVKLQRPPGRNAPGGLFLFLTECRKKLMLAKNHRVCFYDEAR